MLEGTKNVHFLVKYFIELSFRMAHHLQHFCCNFGFTEYVCVRVYVSLFMVRYFLNPFDILYLYIYIFLGFFWQVFGYSSFM